MTASIQLDKQFAPDLEDLGKLSIRVVVVPRKDDAGAAAPAAPAPDEDDFALAVGKSPIDSYLERHDGRGKGCVLFTLNGQRQDTLDQAFVSRDLAKRYLRNRTLIIVELDGLSPMALGSLLKGDRAGLYQGETLDAIRKRVVATLKKDPDLERLETEAEDQLAQLDSGDEAIKKELDAAIEAQLQREQPNLTELPVAPGGQAVLDFGDPARQTVVVAQGGAGVAQGPVLEGDGPSALRLRPDVARSIAITATPKEAWSGLKAFKVHVDPPIAELQVVAEDVPDGKRITLHYHEEDADEDQYPIETRLQVVGKFEGYDELRLVEKEILISPPREPRPPKPRPPLLDEPTVLRVVARQPVPLVPGGASAHVRVKWNGKDDLVSGPRPTWTLHARCTTIGSFPTITTTDPREGRFELLVDAPRTLLVGQDLTFEVEAHGPKGRTLRCEFRARLEPELEEEEAAGTKKRKVPELTLRNPRAYDLKLVDEAKWDLCQQYWRKEKWDSQSVGCFRPPTKTTLLLLMINEDYEPLRKAREEMVKHKLAEATIAARMTKYYTNIALHLYSMFRDQQRLEQVESTEAEGRSNSEGETEDYMEAEIARVAATALRMLA